jgi:hypothetical protein
MAEYVEGARHLSAEWIGVLAGPTAWAFDLLASYALVKWTCGSQHTSVLHFITVAALVAIVCGALASWTALAATPEDATLDGGRPGDRARFVAVLGLVMCGFFTVVVLATAVPRWVLDACQ